MTNETVDTVYKYTIRNGKFFCHEGKVIGDGRCKYAHFRSIGMKLRCPKETEFGVVLTSGPSVWLTERDDRRAKELFVEFELQKISELYQQINTKFEILEMLQEEGLA